MEFVRYIDKTREYYKKQGYDAAYRWANNASAPFTPLKKPLAESRAVLISTAGFLVAPENGFSEAELSDFKAGGSNMGSYEIEVYPVPNDIAEERIVYVKGNHDRSQSDMADSNAFFPTTRLREFRDDGRLGSLAEDFIRFKENYSQRKTMEVDAPEVLRRCREAKVDIALMAPV